MEVCVSENSGSAVAEAINTYVLRNDLKVDAGDEGG